MNVKQINSIHRAADHHLVMGKLESMKPKPLKKPKIKKLDPDYFFSLCVRTRANWTCEACGKHYEPFYTSAGYPANPGLHTSHYIGRANYAVRFEPINADAECYGCHAKHEGNPHAFMTWKLERLGKSLYDVLIEKSNNIILGKQARREKQEIAEHFKAEFERMKALRDNGKVGRIKFVGYL